MKYSNKKRRANSTTQEFQGSNESGQPPGPVYEEVTVENNSGTIHLSQNLAYQCTTNM